MNLRGIVLMVSLWPGLAAPAGLSADRACKRLIDAAQARQLAGAGKRGTYVCERQEEASAHFVFALRWRGSGLPSSGSNLVGYYLVDAVGGSIRAWNLGDDQPGDALAPISPANSPRKH